MGRIMRRAGLVVLTVATATTAFSTAAQATPKNGVCETGEFCVYENYNRTGGIVDWTGPDTNYNDNSWIGTTDGIDNETSSAWNREPCQVQLWQNVGGSGAVARISAGRIVDNVRDDTDLGDNMASAHTMSC
ncbi:peptidase inhibitor family I36 protein [Nonomuraea sp. B12E4]|uniref:peptidase inhibitor family I36 protein n=1 Tax=Nonomuraea sp. B12E4 TaxID=3153564 RepID=UPI00325E3CEF